MTLLSADTASETALLTRFAAGAARVIERVDGPELLPELGAALANLVPFQNLLVVHYEDECVAELVHTNLDMKRLQKQMAPYVAGLYLLDPFHIAATAGRAGLIWLREVAPEDFHHSEFWLRFYGKVGVLDEAHFVTMLSPTRSVHVFVERERPADEFSAAEIARLRGVAPFVCSTMVRHWTWRQAGMSTAATAQQPLGFGLRNVIESLGDGALTPREVDIVELVLKGHSSKSIAVELAIGEGTVTNHKRNLYAKLDINSQAQLFHLFLQALFSGAAGGRLAQLAPDLAARGH